MHNGGFCTLGTGSDLDSDSGKAKKSDLTFPSMNRAGFFASADKDSLSESVQSVTQIRPMSKSIKGDALGSPHQSCHLVSGATNAHSASSLNVDAMDGRSNGRPEFVKLFKQMMRQLAEEDDDAPEPSTSRGGFNRGRGNFRGQRGGNSRGQRGGRHFEKPSLSMLTNAQFNELKNTLKVGGRITRAQYKELKCMLKGAVREQFEQWMNSDRGAQMPGWTFHVDKYGCIRLDGDRKNKQKKDDDVGPPVLVFSSTKKIASNTDDDDIEDFDAEDQNAEEPEVKRARKDDNDDPPAATGALTA